MNDKPILSKEYSIPKEMFADAFRDFQKKYSYPKNIIMTAAFAFIAISYIISLIRDPENSICMLIITVCIFLIAGIWINMLVIRKNLMNAVEGIQNDIYIAELFENSITISTSDMPEQDNKDDVKSDQSDNEEDFFEEKESESVNDGIVKTVIEFSKDNVHVLEKKYYFIIYLVKKNFYILPKEKFTSDEMSILRKSFEKTKFISDNKNS